MDIFDKAAKNIKYRTRTLISRLKSYFRKLLFPLYLFPVKLLTYSLYYLVKFIFKLIFAIISLIFDCIGYPFKSLKNFLKSIVIFIVGLYLFASFFVIVDYLGKQYGYIGKFFCSFGTKEKLQASVVRIVGGYSEGSGFFISPNEVITNFHVIADEPSPKVILPNGEFVTPEKIVGNKSADLAVLTIKERHPEIVLPLLGFDEYISISEDELLESTGYPLGTDLTGKATVVKGNFISFRKSKKDPVSYVQTNINLVAGMSGGPLTDQCGKVIGINTQGLAGLSLFVSSSWAKNLIPSFTDQGVEKINVDASFSPEKAVEAFYTYLKARRMEDGFKLLSKDYLTKTSFDEWTTRFTNILDVDVIKTEKFENTKDTVFLKFLTKNWVDGEVEIHYYEGTWQTVPEDGLFKMNKSKILEVDRPSWGWFYE